MTIRIINADVMDGLKTLGDESVHTVVTSPPYFGLRDYGVEGQIGLEPTPAEFVARLVEVFREVRRVLRDDGTCWLNMGDSYNNFRSQMGPGQAVHGRDQLRGKPDVKAKTRGVEGMKEKDLMLIPERLAIALCDDGWYIRSRIIWHKPNPMPESVTDRPTKSHEHIWLMSKAPRYFYDAEAIKEEISDISRAGTIAGGKGRKDAAFGAAAGDVHRGGLGGIITENRNARDVWTIATSPFAEAHFATFPPELAERCIKAGTSEKGCCATCGKPWERQTEVERYPTRAAVAIKADASRNDGGRADRVMSSVATVGWSRGCYCAAVGGEFKTVPCTVLDPFGGSGTTGLVADRLQRNAILIELNPQYAAMAQKRLTNDAPLFTEVSL